MTLRSRSKKWCSSCAILLSLVLLGLPAVLCAATLSVVEESSGYFRIDGADLADVAALDLSVSYDAATLRISQVTAGDLLQGMLFAGNAGISGSVKIGAAGSKAVSGSGVLARLSGATLRDPVVISSFAARLYDSVGKDIPARTRISLLSTSTGAAAETATSTSVGTSGSVSTRASETLPAVPKEQAGAGSAETPTAQPDVGQERDSATPALPWELTTEGSDKARVGLVSARERFAAFTGKRTLAELAPLFRNDSKVTVQTPAILLTDGTTPLELVVFLTARQKPSVALKNARLLQAKFLDDKRFLVRCLPAAGAVAAHIVLLDAQRMLTIPLTVAPPVTVPPITEPDAPLPPLDLDGDGRSTWKDDYILVANLLARSAPGQ